MSEISRSDSGRLISEHIVQSVVDCMRVKAHTSAVEL